VGALFARESARAIGNFSYQLLAISGQLSAVSYQPTPHSLLPALLAFSQRLRDATGNPGYSNVRHLPALFQAVLAEAVLA